MSEAAKYPVSQTFTVLDGYDIYRSSNLIVALVVVQSQFGKDLRLYRWLKRNDQWKVDPMQDGGRQVEVGRNSSKGQGVH
jgi:hypothetical protein